MTLLSAHDGDRPRAGELSSSSADLRTRAEQLDGKNRLFNEIDDFMKSADTRWSAERMEKALKSWAQRLLDLMDAITSTKQDHNVAMDTDLPPSLAAQVQLFREDPEAWHTEWRRMHDFKVKLIERAQTAEAEIARLREESHHLGWYAFCEQHQRKTDDLCPRCEVARLREDGAKLREGIRSGFLDRAEKAEAGLAAARQSIAALRDDMLHVCSDLDGQSCRAPGVMVDLEAREVMGWTDRLAALTDPSSLTKEQE